VDGLETLLAAARRFCGALPDTRTGANRQYPRAEIGMAAFAVFFAQSPSFLAHQRHLVEGHGRSNAHTLQALTTYLVFSSWTELLQTLAFARPPPRPP
jgi:hypothetical protein